MPNHQGGLDALCGFYAVVNALEVCGGQDSEGLFRTACQAVAKRRWPEVLWEGTFIRDLQKMSRRCIAEHPEIAHVEVSCPFTKAEPGSNEAFWAEVEDMFHNKGATCAILRLEEPDEHWTVLTKPHGLMEFVDSDPDTPTFKKRRASLYAGYRRRNPKQWRIRRKDLIVFYS